MKKSSNTMPNPAIPDPITAYNQALDAVRELRDPIMHLLPSESEWVAEHTETLRFKHIEVLHAAETAVLAGYTLAIEYDTDTGYRWIWIRRGPEINNGLKIRPVMINDGLLHSQNLPKKNLGVLTLLKWASVLESPPDFDSPDLHLVDLDDITASPISPSEVMLLIEKEAKRHGVPRITYDRKTLTVGERRLQYRAKAVPTFGAVPPNFLLSHATTWAKLRDHMAKEVTNVQWKVLDYSYPRPQQRVAVELTYTTLHQEIRVMRLDRREDINSLGLSVLSMLIDGTER